MKVGKIFIFICLLIIFIYPFRLFSNSIDIEILGGFSNIKMDGYNSYIDTVNEKNSLLGIKSLMKKIETGLVPEINICYQINTPVLILGLYLRNQYIFVLNNSSVIEWDNGKSAQIINVDFNVLYTGIGVRMSISNNEFSFLNGFIGVDGGICYYFWNKMYEEINQETGVNIYKINKNWTTIIPGMNFEAGIQWMLNDTIGFILKGGYRLASGNVTVKINNINGWTGPTESEDSVDYSGFYAGTGIYVKFNNNKNEDYKEEKIDRNPNFPGLSKWLYNEAKSFYEDGLYKQAKEKILEAEKIAGNNEMIIELKIQIENKLNKENTEEKINKLIKLAEEYRYKKQFNNARQLYREIISINEKNKQAQFYLKEFDIKAREEFSKADDFMKTGRLKDALNSINLAIEYGIGKEGEDLKNNIEEKINQNKQKDKLYNEGVEMYRKGEYKEAINKWQQVLQIDPKDKDATENIKKAELKLKETSEEKDSEIKKNIDEATKFFNIGNFDTALEKCEYVLRLDSNNSECKKMIEQIKKIQEENKIEVIKKR